MFRWSHKISQKNSLFSLDFLSDHRDPLEPYSKGANAITTRGKSMININTQGNDHIVKLNGDINFNVTKNEGGLVADSTVNIKLTNKDSYLNGNIIWSLIW